MGELATLHPQSSLKDRTNNLSHTPMKSRRTVKFTHNPTNPNSTLPNSRGKTQYPKERHMASNNLVMGQVKILKRGEESSVILKEVNSRAVSIGPKSAPENNREISEVLITKRSDLHLPAKKKTEKRKIVRSEAVVGFRTEDFGLSSTNRLGPEPEMVPKQMKNMKECYAGSSFPDSPPPSLLPLPRFSIHNSS